MTETARDDARTELPSTSGYAAWPPHRTLWFWLMLGWTVSAADRAVTGPVVTWMIGNHVSFLADASKPYALGGLIGVTVGLIGSRFEIAGHSAATGIDRETA